MERTPPLPADGSALVARWAACAWLLVLVGIFAGQAGLTLLLFGAEQPLERLRDEQPILSGRHALHLYHGYLGSQALIDPTKLHPLNRWYAVAQTFDGHAYRAYVDGVLQGEAVVANFVPHGPGRVMVGTRMNHVNYFHGAVALARFTDRALAPAQFVKAAN